MSHRFWPAAGALLALPMGAFAAAPARQVVWKLDQAPALLRLTHDSEPVRYGGAGRYRTQLVLECLTASRQLTARIESQVKSGGPFIIRFDAEPATTVGRPGDADWSNDRQRYLLRVPAEAMPRFASDARTSKRAMIRHDFNSVLHDVHFDLAGLEAAFKPLAEACTVAAPEPRAATLAPQAPRPTPKPDRQIGSWLVTETLSTVDDKLVRFGG